MLILDRHASHVTIAVLQYTIANSLHIFQLPAHSSYFTQPLDACEFGIFKRNVADFLGDFTRNNGLKMPVKHITSPFAGSGIFPVEMERGFNPLNRRGGKRKTLSFDRPALTDVPSLVNEKHISSSLHRNAERRLQQPGHVVTGLRGRTVVLGEYIKEKESFVHPGSMRNKRGLTKGGLLTHTPVMAEHGCQKNKESRGRFEEGETRRNGS